MTKNLLPRVSHIACKTHHRNSKTESQEILLHDDGEPWTYYRTTIRIEIQTYLREDYQPRNSVIINFEKYFQALQATHWG